MMFVFYCLMFKTKTRSLYSVWGGLMHAGEERPDLWRASSPNQTAKTFLCKTRELFDLEAFTLVLQWIVPLQRNFPGCHNSNYYYQKDYLLACWMRRSSSNWGVAGGCISITFLGANSDFRTDVCDCREGTEKAVEKIYKRWGLQWWLWINYSFKSWFLLKFC